MWTEIRFFDFPNDVPHSFFVDWLLLPKCVRAFQHTTAESSHWLRFRGWSLLMTLNWVICDFTQENFLPPFSVRLEYVFFTFRVFALWENSCESASVCGNQNLSMFVNAPYQNWAWRPNSIEVIPLIRAFSFSIVAAHAQNDYEKDGGLLLLLPAAHLGKCAPQVEKKNPAKKLHAT